MIDTDTIVNYLADSLSNRWSVTSKPNTPVFIKLVCGGGKVCIINTDRIVYINEDSRLVTLTDGNALVPTPESMSHLLQLLNPA